MSLEIDANKALELINSGKWRQLEGSVGKWCNEWIESGVIEKDKEATEKKGPVSFVDGFGQFQNQWRFKINREKLNQAIEDAYFDSEDEPEMLFNNK